MPVTPVIVESYASKFFRNSSGEMSACRSTLRSVPTATSSWSGKTHPRSFFRRMIWLPLRRTMTKPMRSSVARIFRSDVRGSLGMRHFERRHEGMRSHGLGEFFQIELRRFFQILQRLFHGMSLACRTRFRAIGDEDAVFFMDDCCPHVSILSQVIL